MNPLMYSRINPLSQSNLNLDQLFSDSNNFASDIPEFSLAGTQYSLYAPVNANKRNVPTLAEIVEAEKSEYYLQKAPTNNPRNNISPQDLPILNNSKFSLPPTRTVQNSTLLPQVPQQQRTRSVNIQSAPKSTSNLALNNKYNDTAVRSSYLSAITNNSSTDVPENCFQKPMSVVRVFSSLKSYGRKLFRKKKSHRPPTPIARWENDAIPVKQTVNVPPSSDFRVPNRSEEFLFTGKSRMVTQVDENGENVMVLPDGHRMKHPKPSNSPTIPKVISKEDTFVRNPGFGGGSKSSLAMPETNVLGVEKDDEFVTEEEDLETITKQKYHQRQFESFQQDLKSNYGSNFHSRKSKYSAKHDSLEPPDYVATRKNTFASNTESMIPQVGSVLHDNEFTLNEHVENLASFSSAKKRLMSPPLIKSNSVKSYATNITNQTVLAHPAGVFRTGGANPKHRRNRSTQSHHKSISNASSAMMYPRNNNIHDQELSLPRTNASSVLIHSVDATPTSSNRNTMTYPSSSPTSMDVTQEAINGIHRWLENQIRAEITGKSPRPRSHSGISIHSNGTTSGKRRSSQSLRHKRNVRHSYDSTVESVRWLNAVNERNLTPEEKQERMMMIQESITRAAAKAVASAAAQFMAQNSNSFEHQTTADFLEWYVVGLQKYLLKMRKTQRRYSKSNSVSGRYSKSRYRSSTASSGRWRKIKVSTPTLPQMPVDQRPLRDSLALAHAWQSQKEHDPISPGYSIMASRGDLSERLMDDNVSEALESISEPDEKPFVMVHETVRSMKSVNSGISIDFSINTEAAVFGAVRKNTQGSTTTTSTIINPDLWVPPPGRVIRHKRGRNSAVYSYQEDERRIIKGNKVEEIGENASMWAPSDTEYDFYMQEELTQMRSAPPKILQSLYQHPEATTNNGVASALNSISQNNEASQELPIYNNFQSISNVQQHFNLTVTQHQPPPRMSSAMHFSRQSDISLFNNSEKHGTNKVKHSHNKKSSGAITPTWYWTDEVYKQTALSTTEDLGHYVEGNREKSQQNVPPHSRFDENSQSESEAGGIFEIQKRDDIAAMKEQELLEAVDKADGVRKSTSSGSSEFYENEIGSSGSVLDDLGLFKEDEDDSEEDEEEHSLMKEIEEKLIENMGPETFLGLSKSKEPKKAASAELKSASPSVQKVTEYQMQSRIELPDRARTPTPTTCQDTTLFSPNSETVVTATTPETIATSPNSSLMGKGFEEKVECSDDDTPTPSVNLVDTYETSEWAAAEVERGKPVNFEDAKKKVEEAAEKVRVHSLRLSNSASSSQRNSILSPPKIPLPTLNITAPSSDVNNSSGGGSGKTSVKHDSVSLAPRPYIPSRTALSNPTSLNNIDNPPGTAHSNPNPLLTTNSQTINPNASYVRLSSTAAYQSNNLKKQHSNPQILGSTFGNNSSSLSMEADNSNGSILSIYENSGRRSVSPLRNYQGVGSNVADTTNAIEKSSNSGGGVGNVNYSKIIPGKNTVFKALQNFGPEVDFAMKASTSTNIRGKIPNFDEKLEMKPGDKVILIEVS
ncbi:hypothetical protein HK098_004059 [Nowakowskiella sp. JEL0407]|nr:hypothetical protein HK098_004059 [Nowakowskiella sp. JEL0407]